jgi:hypothetical protein
MCGIGRKNKDYNKDEAAPETKISGAASIETCQNILFA